MNNNFLQDEELERVPFVFEKVNLKYPEEIKGLVSIIVPIYNVEPYLREALDSVIAQSFENWEAILVNDGSPDKCSEICEEYVKKDARFKYVCKENEGLLLARKTGLEHSKGEFIANLDSDDALHPQFLKKTFDKIQSGNYDFVWCDVRDFDGRTKIGGVKKHTTFSKSKIENMYKYFNYDFGLPLWNKLIKRNIYSRVIFPQQWLTMGEDVIQVPQIIYHSSSAEYIPEGLYYYRRSSIASITNNPSLNNFGLKALISQMNRSIILYLLSKHFFGINEAEKVLANKFADFDIYFTVEKHNIIQLEYVQNFVPCFYSGLKQIKPNNLRWVCCVLACNGITKPIIVYQRGYGALKGYFRKMEWVRRIYNKLKGF
jgi:glycosyltransferase involved in cell wall biosynthesis